MKDMRPLTPSQRTAIEPLLRPRQRLSLWQRFLVWLRTIDNQQDGEG